eukprot:807703-Amphidinium_carterae.1
MYPIPAKRGKALRALRRPESRDGFYTQHGHTKVRRDRQLTVGTSLGITLKADRTVMDDLIKMGIMPA